MASRDSRPDIVVYGPGSVLEIGDGTEKTGIRVVVIDVRIENSACWYNVAWYSGSDRKTALVSENEIVRDHFVNSLTIGFHPTDLCDHTGDEGHRCLRHPGHVGRHIT